MKIGLFCPNWVGDLVMATPAMRAVRTQFPQAQIVGIVRPELQHLLEGTGLWDDCFCLPAPRKLSYSQTWQAISRIRQHHFDMTLLFTHSFRTAWWSWVSGAKRRIGYARNARSWLLTDAIPCHDRKIPHPVMDDYRRLAEELGCRSVTNQIELAVTPEDESQLQQFWARHPGAASRGVVSLNVGGAFGAAKHYPISSAAELARDIANSLEKTVLVLCGPAEREQARKITQLADHPHVVSLADGPLSLGLSKAAIKASELLISTDSGPRHFAAGLGTPVVSLFGPTHQAWSENGHPRNLSLQVAVDCGPCQRRTCPQGHHRCMTELTPQRVLVAVQQLLQECSSHVRAA